VQEVMTPDDRQGGCREHRNEPESKHLVTSSDRRSRFCSCIGFVAKGSITRRSGPAPVPGTRTKSSRTIHRTLDLQG
jgi:hypothetical protein